MVGVDAELFTFCHCRPGQQQLISCTVPCKECRTRMYCCQHCPSCCASSPYLVKMPISRSPCPQCKFWQTWHSSSGQTSDHTSGMFLPTCFARHHCLAGGHPSLSCALTRLCSSWRQGLSNLFHSRSICGACHQGALLAVHVHMQLCIISIRHQNAMKHTH